MFCAKCGTQLQTGVRFCQSCGAPVTQAATASPTPQPSQVTPPPATGGQAPAPPRKSGGALKVILIALGVIVILFVLVIVGIGIFVKKAVLDNVSVKEGPGGKAEVSINTPGGQLKVSSHPEITEEKLGVPIYPGAKADEGAGTLTFSGNDQKGGTFGGASFTTSDSMDKVVDFYKGRLGGKVTTVESTSSGKHTVVLTVATENAWKTITIEDQGNGITKIAVASITGRSPQ